MEDAEEEHVRDSLTLVWDQFRLIFTLCSRADKFWLGRNGHLHIATVESLRHR